MQDLSADVRQSAFALVGDLAKVAAMHLMPSTADLLALGVANLQPAMLRAETMSACNNACWSLGESPCVSRYLLPPCWRAQRQTGSCMRSTRQCLMWTRAGAPHAVAVAMLFLACRTMCTVV